VTRLATYVEKEGRFFLDTVVFGQKAACDKFETGDPDDAA